MRVSMPTYVYKFCAYNVDSVCMCVSDYVIMCCFCMRVCVCASVFVYARKCANRCGCGKGRGKGSEWGVNITTKVTKMQSNV